MNIFDPHHRKAPVLLAISIGLFLLLDVAMLMLNFHITAEVTSDALEINLAGRQRMLSQRMSKAVFQIDESRLQDPSSQILSTEFGKVFSLFTETLRGFEFGGLVTDAKGNRVHFDGLTSDQELALIAQANEELKPLLPLYDQFTQSGFDQTLLQNLRRRLAEKNNKLLFLMNELTNTVESASNSKTQRLRLIQTVTFILALFNFVHIIVLFRRIHLQSQQMIESMQALFEGTNAALLVFSKEHELIFSNAFARYLFDYKETDFTGLNRRKLLVSENNSTFAVCSDGAKFEIEMHTRMLQLHGHTVEVVTVVDISHHKSTERRLSEMANRDELTGLFNRRVLPDIFHTEMERAMQNEISLACFFIDLNGFKDINDIYGHEAGDFLLKRLAQRLMRQMRNHDTIFRYGGDEFVILVPMKDSDDSIRRVSDKLVQIVNSPVVLPDGKEICVFISAGVSVYPQDATHRDGLIAAADSTMYKIKADGGGILRYGDQTPIFSGKTV